MADLPLSFNEMILTKKIEITMADTEENFDFYVSNKNILFVKEIKHIFKKSDYNITRFPLQLIQYVDGTPFFHIKQTSSCIWTISFICKRDLIQFVVEDDFNGVNAMVNEITRIIEDNTTQKAVEVRNNQSSVIQKKYCMECGEQIDANSLFCENCGAKVN